MTNPNNAVGTPAALNGRTSVEAFNDLTQMLTSGILSGWAVSPSSGMTVSIGGVSGIRDVAIAENPSGLLTTVNNISKTPISLTIATASTTSSRVDSIVAYVNSPASSSAAATDNPSVCGLLDVQGTTSAPTEEMIRSAITNDGGTGTTACYVVLATISIPANTTTITGSNITAGDKSSLANLVIDSDNIADDAITSSKILNGAVGTAQIANSAITNAKMASNSVNTAQIANGAVTHAKIGQGAVEADNINFVTFGYTPCSSSIVLSSDSSFMSLSIPEAVLNALNNHKTIEVQIDFLIKTDSGSGYGAYINPYPLSSQEAFTNQFILQNGSNISGGNQQRSGYSIFIGDTGSEGVISGVSKILITSPVDADGSTIEFAGTSSLAFSGASGNDKCYWINSRSWTSASSVTSFRFMSSKSGARILSGSSATAVFKVFG